MALHITAAQAYSLPALNALLITVNAALASGTITVATAVQGTIAIISNPTVGTSFKYDGLTGQGAVTITPSATCDITASPLSNVS